MGLNHLNDLYEGEKQVVMGNNWEEKIYKKILALGKPQK